MRTTIPLAAALATAAGAALVLLNAPTAHAIKCPEGTRYQTIYPAGQPVGVCVPYQHCDPGPCEPPPTAGPRQ